MRIRSILAFSALSLVILLGGGCLLHPQPGVNSGAVASEMAILKGIQTSVTDLQAKEAARETAQATLNTNTATIGQFVVDRATEAAFVAQNGLEQTPVTALIVAQLNPAIMALGYKPSTEVKDREIADLQLAQSRSASDIATLKARNDALATQAGQLALATTTLTTDLHVKEQALTASGQQVAAKVSDLAIANSAAQISASEAKAAHDQAQSDLAAKTRLETARWYMVIGGALFALGVVGLFFHIPYASVSVCVGLILSSAGWLMTYVENLLQKPWFQYTLDGLIAVGFLSFCLFVYHAVKHHATTANTATALDNVVGAIQQASTVNPGLAQQLAPVLQQWHVNAAGAADAGVVSVINAAAIRVNAVNPGQSAVATGIVSLPLPAAPTGGTSAS